MTTKAAEIQAVLDRSRARLDSISPHERDAYSAYMNRTANAWKEQEQVDPLERFASALNAKLDQMEADLASASQTGETEDGYMAMLEERADSLSEEVDSFIASMKSQTGSSRVNDSYNDRMDRLGSAWKDEAKPAAKAPAKPAQPAKRIAAGDAQSTLDAAYKARQERTANAWKDGRESSPVASAAPDLVFGC